MCFLYIIISITILLIFVFSFKKEEFYSELKINKCRKDFDFFERLREYMLETENNKFGSFIKGCQGDRLHLNIQKKAFEDEAKFQEINNLKLQCNELANKECTFTLDLPSLNVKCHNDYFNWCVDTYK